VGDGEKLLTHLNSALKVLLGLDIFPRVPKKKVNFVDQCYGRNKLCLVSSLGSEPRLAQSQTGGLQLFRRLGEAVCSVLHSFLPYVHSTKCVQYTVCGM